MSQHRRLARRGYKVYATLRKMAKGDKIRTAADHEYLSLVIETPDVSDNKSIMDCVVRIIEVDRRIDVLINNADLSSSLPIETYPGDEHRAFLKPIFGDR